MKQIIYILLSTLFVASTSTANQDYPFIEPLNVEHSVTKKAPVIVQKEAPKKEIIKKSTTLKKSTQPIISDADMDGIADAQDHCPNTSKTFTVDKNGCPDATTLNINFSYKKYTIPNTAKEQFDTFAAFLHKHKHYHIIIYGYTDNVGNFKSNKKLSQNRANAVKKELIKRKISSVRITAIGKSQDNPIANNEDEEGRAKNRRIEIELLK